MKRIIAAAVLLAAAVGASPIAAQSTCDRTCLLKTADDYLSALVAHDPSKAPMAANAKFTEQTKVMKVGEEGLWKSAISTSATFKIPVPDPVSGQIGMIVMMHRSPPNLDCRRGTRSGFRPHNVPAPDAAEIDHDSQTRRDDK